MILSAATILEHIANDNEFANQFDPVIKLARQLPPFSGNMLEVHTNRDDQWFDFSFRINNEYDKPLLSRKLVLKNSSSFIERGYEQLLATSKKGFRYGIENIWFEYDFPHHKDPSLFFDLHRNTVHTPQEIFDDLKTLTRIFNYPCNPEILDLLIKLKENNLAVVYYGLMFPRKPASIRLTIKGVKPANLVETVMALGWPGNLHRLTELHDTYLDSSQQLLLDIDWDRRPGTRIGIEIFDINPVSLLDKLHNNKFFKKNQYDMLKNWPAISSLSLNILSALTVLYQRPVNSFSKRLNHFKFSLDNDKIIAKAYLYYCF